MDNTFSQPGLDIPEIPDDFETKCGTSKLDFARALRSLLLGTQVTGITATGPQPYDLTSLANQVKELQTSVQNVPIIRQIVKPGATDANITVDFEDVGTTDYSVYVSALIPDANINTVTWGIIDGSRKSNQVIVRIDGTGAAYNFLVTIITVPT